MAKKKAKKKNIAGKAKKRAAVKKVAKKKAAKKATGKAVAKNKSGKMNLAPRSGANLRASIDTVLAALGCVPCASCLGQSEGIDSRSDCIVFAARSL